MSVRSSFPEKGFWNKNAVAKRTKNSEREIDVNEVPRVTVDILLLVTQRLARQIAAVFRLYMSCRALPLYLSSIVQFRSIIVGPRKMANDLKNQIMAGTDGHWPK